MHVVFCTSCGNEMFNKTKEDSLCGMCEKNQKLKELLQRLYKATSKLDLHYCTILNREDFSLGMTGAEYEEINDLLIEVGEFLGESE